MKMTNSTTDHLSGVFSTYSNGDQGVAPVVTPDQNTIDARLAQTMAPFDAQPPASEPTGLTTTDVNEQMEAAEHAAAQAFPRAQLLGVLEAVLTQLKQDPAFDMTVSDVQQINLKLDQVNVNDRTDEIDQLKSLLIEAQETIIKLLSDRVDDRAKIANLEAEAKYLPITKKNNTEQQLGLAIEYEAMRKELVRVSVELGQLEKMHASLRLKQKTNSFWSRLFRSNQV
jgi:hypothetical protein